MLATSNSVSYVMMFCVVPAAKEYSTLPHPTHHHHPPGAFPEGLAAAAAGNSSSSCALVLIDRSLDLATPCMHQPLDAQLDTIHPLDIILGTFPRGAAAVSAAAAGGGAGSWARRSSTTGGGGGRPRVDLRWVKVDNEAHGVAVFPVPCFW